MRFISFLLPFLFIICGCGLLQAEYNSYDYTIEQGRDCFCPKSGVWAKLYVKADSVSKAIRISDNYNLSYNESRRYKPIKGLFDEIALRDTARYEVNIVMDSKITILRLYISIQNH